MTTQVAYILIATLVTMTVILIVVGIVVAVRQSSKVDRKAEGQSITVSELATHEPTLNMQITLENDIVREYLTQGIARELKVSVDRVDFISLVKGKKDEALRAQFLVRFYSTNR